ncbi:MAG: class I SAM-dependent methyltransferase [Chloroflexaceae bacterium]|nr:class I SAM-dependent methyltransferase [Chloroflexaceae bacterium]
MSFNESELYSGLATLHWGNYHDNGWDHDFYKRVIERSGGPALELGCGGGRLLRAYRRAGLEVDGCDIAADMVETCRRNAEAEGLHPTLYCQAMQELDVPRRYRTIYIPCGSIVCVMGRRHAIEAMRRCHEHLHQGGTLAFNVFVPDYDYSGRSPLPRPLGEWYRHHEVPLEGGRRLVIHRRPVAIDPVEQIEQEERRFELYDGETLLHSEVRAGQNHWYFKHEVLLMLELAGFHHVQVKGDYSDDDFGPQHRGTMVFLAHKGGTHAQNI